MTGKTRGEYATCPCCEQARVMYFRGICRRCYNDPVKREQFKTIEPLAAGYDDKGGDGMPNKVYAIVRAVRSPLCGKLKILVAWYLKRYDAVAIAEKCCRRFSVRVELWNRVKERRRRPGRCKNGQSRRVRRGKGNLRTEVIAVYRRCERVRREVAA